MSVRLITATMAFLALGLSGCGASPPRSETPALPSDQPRPDLMPAAPPSESAALSEGASLSLAVVLDLAQQASPNRALFEANRAAAEAAISQTRAWANPELELNGGRAKARQENEDGQRPATIIGGVSLKQRFELPGKRSSRIAVAEANRAVAQVETRLDRLELEVEIRSAVLAVASADARVIQAQHVAELSAQVSTAVEHRVQAGETDRGDLARAQTDDEIAKLATTAAQAQAEAARAALRIWCGGRLPQQFTLNGLLSENPPTLVLSDIQQRALAAHPKLAVYTARQTALTTAIAAEERAWYPDLTLGVSGSRQTDTNDLGVSVGIDLPLWNRNEGGVAQAHADLARLEAQHRKELLALQRDVLTAWSAYERERQQIAGLTTRAIPAAQQALQYKLTAFQVGEANLLEIIDARRAALTAEVAVIDARERAAQAFIALVIASGGDPTAPQPLHSLPSTAPAGALP